MEGAESRTPPIVASDKGTPKSGRGTPRVYFDRGTPSSGGAGTVFCCCQCRQLRRNSRGSVYSTNSHPTTPPQLTTTASTPPPVLLVQPNKGKAFESGQIRTKTAASKRAVGLRRCCCSPRWIQGWFGGNTVRGGAAESSEEEYDPDPPPRQHRKSSVLSAALRSLSGVQNGGGGPGSDCTSVGGGIYEDGSVGGGHSETSPFLPNTASTRRLGSGYSRRKYSGAECNASVHALSLNGGPSAKQHTASEFLQRRHSNNNENYDFMDVSSLRGALALAASLEAGIGSGGCADSEWVGGVRITQRRCSPIPLIMLDRHTQTKHSKTVTWQCPQCAENMASRSYESAIIQEAHGLISDMLADSFLPPHVVNGLKAVSNLLKPTENTGTSHKPKMSPLVSLNEAITYGSDSEEIPYTGERPTSLPKRLHRSLPTAMIRRMSTSTWTTTTSATGLPTLDTDLIRHRASVRHFPPPSSSSGAISSGAGVSSRDNTPATSPPDTSVANTPENSQPESPATGNTPAKGAAGSLAFPKSRSFSLATVTAGNAVGTDAGTGGGVSAISTSSKRLSRERRSLQNVCSEASGVSVTSQNVSKPDQAANSAANISSSSPSLLPTPQDSKQNIYGSQTASNSNFQSSATSLEPSEPSESPARNATNNFDAGVTSLTNSWMSDSVHSERRDSASDNKDSVADDHFDGMNQDSRYTSDSHQTTSPRTVTNSHQSIAQIPLTHSTSSLASHSATHADTDANTRRLSDVSASKNSAPTSRRSSKEKSVVVARDDGLPFDLGCYDDCNLLEVKALSQWDFPVFDLAAAAPKTILSLVIHRLFIESRLFATFRIPLPEFMQFFHALELGYLEKPYHNRVHATDVLHGVFYLTSQPIPGFRHVNPDPDAKTSSGESDSDFDRGSDCSGDDSGSSSDEGLGDRDRAPEYGVMAGNFPPLELMALYAAAAMHDYDHPGRTNAFLVTTHAPLAILYNDRAVLECHHAASAWHLLLSDHRFNWLSGLDKGEFKRFRFLVIEAILATDLKRHFELLAEFNAKVNDEDAPGIDWTSESDRLMVANIVIKMADINGPAKRKDLHVRWTDAISEEFYEQGDEEASLGLPISPYMDRQNPQLAKLQESFINHLVAPLCNALGAAGLLPGTYVSDSDSTDKSLEERGISKPSNDDNSGEGGCSGSVFFWLTKHLQDNHDMWVRVLKDEASRREETEKTKSEGVVDEMEPIKEEDTPLSSAKIVVPSTQPSSGSTNESHISATNSIQLTTSENTTRRASLNTDSTAMLTSFSSINSQPNDTGVEAVNQREDGSASCVCYQNAPPTTVSATTQMYSNVNTSQVSHTDSAPCPQTSHPVENIEGNIVRRCSNESAPSSHVGTAKIQDVALSGPRRKFSADSATAGGICKDTAYTFEPTPMAKSASLHASFVLGQGGEGRSGGMKHQQMLVTLGEGGHRKRGVASVLGERRKSDTAHVVTVNYSS